MGEGTMSFAGFEPQMAEFFMQIRFNNNAEFFQENRGAYEQYVKAPLYALADDLEPAIHRIDPALETRPAKVVSRIRRDTRFSRDKSPYRDHMWLSWRAPHLPEDKQNTPGLYAAFMADVWEVGCGYYEATPATMKAFREKLLVSPSTFASAVEEAGEFTFSGEDYKRPPQGIEALPEALRPWYMKKSFYLHYEAPYAAQNDPAAYVAELGRLLESLQPFYQYLCDL